MVEYINKNTAALVIQNWWITNKRQNAISTIQKWWVNNRDYNYYYLFIDNSNFYIEELFDRLRTVIVPGIHYICVKKKDTFPKCILFKSNLHRSVINSELRNILQSVGYNYQYVVNQ